MKGNLKVARTDTQRVSNRVGARVCMMAATKVGEKALSSAEVKDDSMAVERVVEMVLKWEMPLVDETVEK
jgi:hypothetical protein